MEETIRRDVDFCLRNRRVVKIWRESLDRYPLLGCIVDASNDFIVVHQMNDGIRLDGYSILRMRDITSVEKKPQYGDFYEKALVLTKQKPKKPSRLRLEDMYSILTSLSKRDEVISLEREKLRNDECAVGKVGMMTKDTIVIKWLTPDAKWDGHSPRYRITDITKVDFANSYLHALTAVVQTTRGKSLKK